jgi:3-oxoacyl-[acyl-carrier-protein] synthase II
MPFAYFQVNYINAHATSTLAGDLAEINAIKKVFKDTSGIKINATKVLACHLLLFAGESFLPSKS